MKKFYNTVSTLKLEVDTKTPYCERAKLDTGTHCNYGCSFCYYKEKLKDKTSFDVIKNRIDYLYDCGIKEVDLSGGESSIHKDWFKILDYCNSLGFNISTLSNGSMFKNYEFLEKSVKKGLNEILFSLHGYDADSHNRIVSNTAGFKDILSAISNSHILGVKIRINCTVTGDNYQELDTKFVELMKVVDPSQINFLTLNYWSDNNKAKTIDYNVITPYIKRTIDRLGDDTEINVRYTPFCFMKGYEKHVVGYYHHIYDLQDWNIAVYDQRVVPKEYRGNELECLYESAKQNRLSSYYKKKECLQCKYYAICDGIENQIKEIKLHPEKGELITEVNHYR
jgi:MoaA/NifB/PqqE/SkfB family radical SAM enzyme